MKISAILLMTTLGLIAKAQNKEVAPDSVIKKWELATINIEAATSFFKEPAKNPVFKRNNDDSNLTSAEKEQRLINLARNKFSSSGTAVFLVYEHIHFLITARHVLEDLNFPIPGFPYNQIFFPENANIANSANFTPASLYLMSLDSNLHARNFIWSSRDTDLAIVALDAYPVGVSDIPKILKDRGYEPIQVASIDTGYQSKKNDVTYSIGFPELSMLGKKASIDTFEVFQSNDVTVPIVSVGRILEGKGATKYIISDVFVYHGNSGGPLIHNNKLIGIVHGANLEKRQAIGTRLKYYFFLNGNQFIKVRYIMPLLRELVKEIKYDRSIRKP
jgi:hypothetical protein